MAVTYAVESDNQTAPQRPMWWALLLGLSGLAAGLIWVTGISAFPLVLVATAAAGLGLAQVSSLRLGFTGALAVVLGGYSILLHFTMAIPWGLAAIGGVSLLALVGAGIAALIRTPNPVLPSRRAAIVGIALTLLALILTVWFIPWRTARGAGPVWAMHNDAVVQMIKTHVQISADGFDTSSALNPSPLPSALIAVAAAVGRIRLTNPNQALENDVLRLAELWGLLILATSALAAWIAWRMATRQARHITNLQPIPDVSPLELAVLPDDVPAPGPAWSRRWLPILGTIIAALLPFTWYFAGFAFAYGFLNSTLSLVLLLLAWAIWLELPDSPPVLVAALLSLVTVAMLATWAPVALITAGLTLLALWKGLRANLAIAGRAGAGGQAWADDALFPNRPAWNWVAWVVAALPVPLYGLFVTIPDFNQQGEALAVAEGIAVIPLYHVLLVGIFAAVAIALYAWASRDSQPIWGMLIVIVTSGILVGFLVHLNTRVGFPGWGYYPVKAAWAVTSLLIIIGIAALFGALLHWRLPALGQGAGMALVTVLSVLIMRQYLWEPLRVVNFFAPVEVLRNSGFAAGPWRANILFDAYRHDQLTILQLEEPRWMVADQIVPGDGRADRFANFWLLQIHPGAGLPGGPEEVARGFAYTLDPRSPEGICAAVETWGQPTTVLTADPNLEALLVTSCPEAPITVEMFNPPWHG